ncbi:MAG: hypothetical protein GXP53_10500 [Deltaproteobacteria bacterium]|nr:hypothetical protein [Deltaproteobacteria bacterium]
MPGKKQKISVEKLIGFFKTLGKSGVAPDVAHGDADYCQWNQTEAEYRQTQAKWLEEVGRQKKLRENKS